MPGSWLLNAEMTAAGSGASVPPEVHEPPREGEDVALRDGLGDELVGGADEADVEHAVEHEDELGGAQVRVRRGPGV